MDLSNYFKVNIFHIDLYITKPGFYQEKFYSKYSKSKLKRVTVVRLFGATNNGLKVCLHIHNYLPHMSIRQSDLFEMYGGHISNDDKSVEKNILALFLLDIETELRKKLNNNRNDLINDGGNEKKETSIGDYKSEFIANIESYLSTSFYGYHDKPECFYRITFFCHSTMDIAKGILENGLVNNTPILLHNCLEVHLQFYIDNQIYLNNLYLKSVTFRRSIPFKGDPKDDEMFKLIDNEKLKSIDFQMDFNQIPATSTSFLECDASVDDIVPIFRPNLFPPNKTFVPSLPGIINLLNEQFLRNANKLAYENVLKPLTNNIERDYPVQNLNENLHYSILESFLNKRSSEICFLQSPVKKDCVDANISDNDCEDEGDVEMSFTQQQLNLSYPKYQNEPAEYFFDDQPMFDDPDFNIPQLDGLDDIKDSVTNTSSKNRKESENKMRQFRLIYQNKKIKFDLNDFGREVISISRISLSKILTTNVAINKELKSKILIGIKKDDNCLGSTENEKTSEQRNECNSSSNVCNLSSVCDSVASVYSYYSNDYNTSIDHIANDSKSMPNFGNSFLRSPLQQCHSFDGHNFHSTPNTMATFAKTSKKRFSISNRRNLKDTFQNEAVLYRADADLKKNDINFVLSQDSQISNDIKLDEMSSINSRTSNSNSCDHLTIETNDKIEWNKNLEMTLMSLELHIQTRDHLLPNPSYDAIQMALFAVYSENLKDSFNEVESNYSQSQQLKLVYLCAIVVRKNSRIKCDKLLLSENKILHIDYVPSEVELLLKLTSYVTNFDPDIVVGYMVDTLSWGYLLQRSIILETDTMSSLSRITNPYQAKGNFPGEMNKPPKLIGRIVLNAWALLNCELTLRSYSFENVFHHLFAQSVPKYSHKHLSSLWRNYQLRLDDQSRQLVTQYYLTRVTGVAKIFAKLNLIGRTYHLSCLFGMKFEDVFNRGSQFRVESMLFPLCKLENFVPIRFPRSYTHRQCAPECIQLVLEPGGIFCKDPVAVLDFQSLYPSIMIAYNYCYSTCLGKVKNIIRSNDSIGCYRLTRQQQLLTKLGKDIHISPNGVAFVKPHVRRGLLPKMLENLLISRILVKTEMKQVAAQLAGQDKLSSNLKRKLKSLKRKLDILQLGLKLIANVTYGYTSANFSGRMPCIDIADSIVSKGRESLEKAISFVNEWGVNSGNGAKVIYGDTDSVFISFPGASLKQAFDWADYMAKEITKQYPYPMAIKVEKIYQPCLLLAKKRYCGYAYECANQSAPMFDAKGIETVRRDSCNATSKILEKCIKILFDSGGDVLQLKPYLQWQIKKILNGRVSLLNDFVFAKEYKGLDNYINQSAIPSCIIAHRRLQRDPMNEPKMYERVPYVIVDGSPHDKLADLARDPLDLLADKQLKLNAPYYIQRVIFPPIARLFEAIPNARLNQLMNWYDEVRHFRANELKNSIEQASHHANKIQNFFRAAFCVICRIKISTNSEQTVSQYPLCANCIRSSQTTTALVKDRFWWIGQKLDSVQRICSKCCGTTSIARMAAMASPDCNLTQICISRQCRYLFRYHQTLDDFDQIHKLDQAIGRQLLEAYNASLF